jgi:hypothetical protein
MEWRVQSQWEQQIGAISGSTCCLQRRSSRASRESTSKAGWRYKSQNNRRSNGSGSFECEPSIRCSPDGVLGACGYHCGCSRRHSHDSRCRGCSPRQFARSRIAGRGQAQPHGGPWRATHREYESVRRDAKSQRAIASRGTHRAAGAIRCPEFNRLLMFKESCQTRSLILTLEW